MKTDTYSFQTQQAAFRSDNTTIKIENGIVRVVLITGFFLLAPLLYYFLILQFKSFFPTNPIVASINASFVSVYIINGILGVLLYRAYSGPGKALFIQFIAFGGFFGVFVWLLRLFV